MKYGIITAGLYMLFLSSACDDAPAPSNREPVPTQTKTEAPSPSAPKFEILEDQDISIGGVKRFVLRVLIEKKPVSKEEIEAVSRMIFSRKSLDKPDEVTVWYYFDRSQSPGSYTLAMAEWTPQGDWKHTFTKHVGELVKDAPTPEDRSPR
jgi:hypothetical protein